MGGYNAWMVGTGGVCDSVWNPGQPSYWCSNGSSGGWAEVDQACAVAGQLQIPVGMTINTSYPLLERVAKWKDPRGAIVHTWHSQSWATHMFRVGGRTAAAGAAVDLAFTSGGQQGGRNWCRCDQCGYAGKWCGQHQDPPNNKDTRLISGSWYVEGVLEELDTPGEWFYAEAERALYFWPNASAVEDLVVSNLRTLVDIQGTAAAPARAIAFNGVGFRDSAATFMDEEWSAPSGGT